ncbi:histidine--tRNA ligase [Johnsonella ignava]|uniref:histidine--tRNA ligase n=1 Tax=Johnsonella ignava TaxID=43995 RepID=UPI0023F12AD5|nr:histidine--tRNA ligase [Johnsonella ignava]
MTLIKKPVTGMKDILPDEMELRDYLIAIIKKTYRSYGFTPIETPAAEHIGNLLSSQGGENEKLIFKILKRGEKLNLNNVDKELDLTDMGLRYDLTLPLARYFAANSSKLPMPFKALQIGSVFRADRPQKGRYRQFTQCDIDIIGDASEFAEIELLLAAASVLSKICPENKFFIRLNNREILKAMSEYAGFISDKLSDVFIILDKMDKIGLAGVQKELIESGCDEKSTSKYTGLLHKLSESKDISKTGDLLKKELEGFINEEVVDSFIFTSEIVNNCKSLDFDIVFDPSLVRGMGYYTGTVFEISMDGFSGSVAGGGRYDKMIGKFTGTDTPACGFSIGFERIIAILCDSGFKIPSLNEKTAFLYEKGIDRKILSDILREAEAERTDGKTVLVSSMNKNKKFQKEQLNKQGYTDFREFYREELKR